MKILLIFLIAFSSTSVVCSQNMRSLLKKEQAFRSSQFLILEVPYSENVLDDPEYNTMHYSDDEGFFYLNISDSLVVIYLNSQEDDFRISERLHVADVISKSPLVIQMVNDDNQNVIMKAVQEDHLKFQFYFTESKVQLKGMNMMMAYEFEGVTQIK